MFSTRRLLAVSLSAGFLFYLGCGKDSGSSSSVGVSGRLSSTDYTVTSLSPLDKIWNLFVERISFAVGTRVDQIYQLPLYGSNFRGQNFSSAKKTSIGSDGTFNLSVDTNQDWIFLLIDTSKASRSDQVVGYLTMTASSSDGLLQMPISKATGGIDLGNVSKNGDETSSSSTTSDNSSKFSITAAQLLALAKSDDTLRLVKNQYVNYDESSKTYVNIQPFYIWYDSSAGSRIVNDFSSPSLTISSHFNGFLYYFNSNHSAFNYTRICNQSDTVLLYAPSSINNSVSNSAIISATTPLTSQGTNSGTSGTSCGVGNLYFRDDTSGGVASYQMNYSANSGSGNEYLSVTGGIPTGNWLLKVNNGTTTTTVATFDGRLGSPFINNDSTKPVVFIPALKATVTNGVVTKLTVKWTQRNTDTGAYEEITDSTLLARMNEPMVELTDYSASPRKEERATITESAGWSYSTKDYTWKYPNQGGSGNATAGAISVGYVMGGVSFRFEYRQN